MRNTLFVHGDALRTRLGTGVVLLAALALVARPATGQDPSANDPTADKSDQAQKAAAELPWLTSLGSAFAQAQRSRKPIFAVVGGKSCQYCRQLEREMRKPE